MQWFEDLGHGEGKINFNDLLTILQFDDKIRAEEAKEKQEVRADVGERPSLLQSALQHPVLGAWSSALAIPWIQVPRGQRAKESAQLNHI